MFTKTSTAKQFKAVAKNRYKGKYFFILVTIRTKIFLKAILVDIKLITFYFLT